MKHLWVIKITTPGIYMKKSRNLYVLSYAYVFLYSLTYFVMPIFKWINNDFISHIEYIADQAVMPISMIEHMEENIGDVGSIISWHASFENTQNKNISILLFRFDMVSKLLPKSKILIILFLIAFTFVSCNSTKIKTAQEIVSQSIKASGANKVSTK